MESGSASRYATHAGEVESGHLQPQCAEKYERYATSISSRDLDAVTSENQVGIAGRDVAEGPMLRMPMDMWIFVTSYLSMSETMSLRCSARVVQRHLKTISDDMLEGCRIIEHVTQPKNRHAIASPETMQQLLALGPAVRCNMLKRYAQQGGSVFFAGNACLIPLKWIPVHRFIHLYSTTQSFDTGSEREGAARSWQHIVAMTKTAILDVPCETARNNALSDLFAAEMYAPLLGGIADPYAHIDCVAQSARAALSPIAWMDFLFAVLPLMAVSSSVAWGYDELTQKFDHRHPMPRMAVMASIVHQAMSMAHATSMRERCLNRMGLSLKCVEEELTPRLARAIVDDVIFKRARMAEDATFGSYLRSFTYAWGDDDGRMLAALNQSFLTLLGERTSARCTLWTLLSEVERQLLRAGEVCIPLSECKQLGLVGEAVIDFWSLYFHIIDPKTMALGLYTESKIDALPWPLRAILWRLAAECRADTEREAWGDDDKAFHELTPGRVDAVVVQALNDGKPGLAIPALLALLRWQVTSALRVTAGPVANVFSPSHYRVMLSLGFSMQVWALFERCSTAERLPFVAALFGYRDLLTKSSYEWTYETLVSENVVSFLCDPACALTQPSAAIVKALLHYLPSCVAYLPEWASCDQDWESAFARRVDIALSEVMHTLRVDPSGLSTFEHEKRT